MARLSDDQISDIFTSHLSKGETLLHFAYGVKTPNMLYMLPLFALAVLPGVIATSILTRHYLVGLTEKRFIVLRIKSFSDGSVSEVIDYELSEFDATPAKTKTGGLFTHIKIENEQKPFAAKFHRAFSKQNRPNAVAITEAISGQTG